MTKPAALLLLAVALLLGPVTAFGAAQEEVAAASADAYAGIFQKFAAYDTVLEPDKNAPEWWAGAPSVVHDPDTGFWMACRMRAGEGPRGLRGYEVRLLRSDDGIHFTPALNIRREDVPIPGFERPALVRDPQTGKFRLYGCGPWKDGPWSIIKWDDADRPDQIVVTSAKPVIVPPEREYERDIVPKGFKDPVILFAEGAWHCYVIGYIRENERIFHFSSPDGENWKPVGDFRIPIMDLTGWHDFFVRPASIVPVGVGYLFVYEGSKTSWHDPVYNVATGLGFTFDLHRITDLTPDTPLALSTTPSADFATLRYSHWLDRGDELWVYAEAARPNESHEIRLFRLKK